MGKSAVAGWAALAMLVSGAALVLAATIRLANLGLFSQEFVGLGELDFVSVSFWLLGAALVVGGVAIALVGLADHFLGALPAEPRADAGPATEIHYSPAARRVDAAVATTQEARPTPADQPTVAALLASTPVVAAPVVTATTATTATTAATATATTATATTATAGPTFAERARPVLAATAARLAQAARTTGSTLGRAARATAHGTRRAAAALVAWVRRTTPLVVAWFRRTGSTIATRARPAAHSTWAGVRHGTRATAAGAVATARATGATARRASSATAARARQNAAALAASRETARQNDRDRELALEAARAGFLASRRAPSATTTASAGEPTAPEASLVDAESAVTSRSA